MKKFVIFALTLVLAAALFAACGCTNSKPAPDQPSTLPPTTGATLMPTTQATTMPTTMPTTMATTAPTTEVTTMPDSGESVGTEGGMTETPTENGGSNDARSRMPGVNGK